MKKLFRFSGCLGTIIVFGILVYLYLSFEKTLTEKEVTVKILDISSIDDAYLVTTKNEIFINKDNSFYDKYDSDQINSKLEKGKTYKLNVVGVRIPFISKYRNIVEVVEEVKPKPDKW
ncbi:MAG TPA: hypothetical protein VMT35_16030 [Ignavibacteriaceae bacterium]|nr:hypothetical protein [Ignavibacteriaceae bacterium]